MESETGKTPLEIVQVSLIVRNIEETIRKLTSLWKVGPFEIRETNHPEAVVHGKKAHVKARLAFAKVGPIELELIEPIKGENIYWEFLQEKGEGVHHLKIPVQDVGREVAKLKEKGIGVLQSADSSRVTYAYLDTEKTFGVIIELLRRKYE